MRNLTKPLLLLLVSGSAAAQSNTAAASGSIGKCSVWGYPYLIYNNSGASQSVGSGITVMVDEDRNTGAVDLSGNGALVMSGSKGITLSGSGTETACRWDLPSAGTAYFVNNNNYYAVNSVGEPYVVYKTSAFFTAPYTGNYRWVLGSGWTASVSGAYLKASIGIFKAGQDFLRNVFAQNEAGTCGMAVPSSTALPATWYPNAEGGGSFSLAAGEKLRYGTSTAYNTTGTCNDTGISFTISAATMYYEN